MNNFTGEIKREIMKNGLENACCKTAALSAFLRTTGSVIRSGENYGFEFVTESEDVAAFFIGILEELYGAELKVEQATTDARNGRDRLVFSCISDKSLYILGQLGIVERGEDSLEFRLDMDKYVVENACCEVAWIKGAFLGSGSCTLPKLEDTRSGITGRSCFPINFWRTTAAACWRCTRYWRGAWRGRAPSSFTSKAGRVFPTFYILRARKGLCRSSTASRIKRTKI